MCVSVCVCVFVLACVCLGESNCVGRCMRSIEIKVPLLATVMEQNSRLSHATIIGRAPDKEYIIAFSCRPHHVSALRLSQM